MKKSICLFSLVMITLLLVSCASNKVDTEKASVPVTSKTVTREMIDWKGASIGAEIPAWVTDAVEDDYAALSKLPQLANKRIICASAQGKNQDLLKSWVNNFDVQASFSKSIRNVVSDKFGGELSGTKDSAVSKSFLDEIVATFSRNEFSGLCKEMDFWVLTRYKDTEKDILTDTYEYFVVYAIEQDTFDYQIADSLGLVEAQTEVEEEMKANIQKAILETQVFAERSKK